MYRIILALFCLFGTHIHAEPIQYTRSLSLPQANVKLVISGKTIDFTKQKPFILCYGASWCPSCTQALTKLDDVAAQLKINHSGETPVNIYAVAEAKDTRHPILTKTLLNLMTVGDCNGALQKLSSVEVFPTFLFVDNQGNLVAKIKGSIDWNDLAVQTFLKEFIEKKGAVSAPFFSKIISWFKDLFS